MPLEDADDLAAWLRLSSVNGLGPVTARTLLAELGPPQHVFAASHATLSRLVGDAVATRLRATPDDTAQTLITTTLAWADTPGHQVLTWADAAFPQQLLTIPDPPLVLYVDGRLDALQRPGIAIVGSRNATPSGLSTARQFAHTLGLAQETVISGLALGIDGAAHEGALDANAPTIAVLGTGVDVIYPAKHKTLAARVRAHGALVSEQPLGTPAIAHHFPRRNRLISGLARGVLIIEAAAQSGSLITARLAAEQGREVFAVPGSIHSPLSKGCHLLIKQGARLVDDVRDILDELHGPGTSVPPSHAQVSDEVPPWLQVMGHDPFTMDELVAQTRADLPALQAALLDWELDGRVARLPGGRWQRL